MVIFARKSVGSQPHSKLSAKLTAAEQQSSATYLLFALTSSGRDASSLLHGITCTH